MTNCCTIKSKTLTKCSVETYFSTTGCVAGLTSKANSSNHRWVSILFFLLPWTWVCMCVGRYTWAQCTWSSKGSIISRGAGVISTCEPLDVGAGTKFRSSAKAVCSPNYWAIHLSSTLLYFRFILFKSLCMWVCTYAQVPVRAKVGDSPGARAIGDSDSSDTGANNLWRSTSAFSCWIISPAQQLFVLTFH